MKKKLISLLVLLMTAATGAWADETPLVTINASSDFTSGSKTFDDKVNIIIEQGENIAYDASKGWFCDGSPVSMTIEPVDGVTISKVKLYFSQATPYEFTSPYIVKLMSNEVWDKPLYAKLGEKGITKIEVYGTPAFDYVFTAADSEHGKIAFFIDQKEVKGANKADEGKQVTMTVSPDKGWVVGTVSATTYTTWAGARRQAPASIPVLGDVELTPAEGAANTWTFTMPAASVEASATYIPVAAFTAAPAAVEGIIAGEDKAIVTAGETEQGTVKYFVTTDGTITAAQAQAANGWVSTLPTAAAYTSEYAEDFKVYVWYYIQAADGYADSEPQCIEVTLLKNIFDLTLSPAPVKNMTVTVAGQAKTPTDEGKVEAVKMQSEVKLKAADGYKFRKVEVKKGGAAGIVNPAVGQIIGSDGKNYDANATLPDGVKAVAVIAYVGSETGNDTYKNGLAIALADEAKSNWSTAMSTCEGKTAITGAKWCLPSQNQWKQMFKANGGNEGSYTGLNTTITNAGGTILQENALYWSSSEFDPGVFAYYVDLYDGSAGWVDGDEGSDRRVRACLAF